MDRVPVCPHCGENMNKWKTSYGSAWETEFQYVCFSDTCPYYVRGWEYMMQQDNVHASYRHRYNPSTGKSGPIPVWSDDALKKDIVDD
jgi:hypothetical protein